MDKPILDEIPLVSSIVVEKLGIGADMKEIIDVLMNNGTTVKFLKDKNLVLNIKTYPSEDEYSQLDLYITVWYYSPILSKEYNYSTT